MATVIVRVLHTSSFGVRCVSECVSDLHQITIDQSIEIFVFVFIFILFIFFAYGSVCTPVSMNHNHSIANSIVLKNIKRSLFKAILG